MDRDLLSNTDVFLYLYPYFTLVLMHPVVSDLFQHNPAMAFERLCSQNQKQTSEQSPHLRRIARMSIVQTDTVSNFLHVRYEEDVEVRECES
jgi:hypothetical protein